jgi:hypothetical protein
MTVNLAIPHLMEIRNPREQGLHCAALGQPDFIPPGRQEIQTPVADAARTKRPCVGLEHGGQFVVYDEHHPLTTEPPPYA